MFGLFKKILKFNEIVRTIQKKIMIFKEMFISEKKTVHDNIKKCL